MRRAQRLSMCPPGDGVRLIPDGSPRFHDYFYNLNTTFVQMRCPQFRSKLKMSKLPVGVKYPILGVEA